MEQADREQYRCSNCHNIHDGEGLFSFIPKGGPCPFVLGKPCRCCSKPVTDISMSGDEICPRCDCGHCRQIHSVEKGETLFEIGDLVKDKETGNFCIIMGGVIRNYSKDQGNITAKYGRGGVVQAKPSQLERLFYTYGDPQTTVNFKDLLIRSLPW